LRWPIAFAADNLQLWRALFEHRMALGKPIPDWAIDQQMELFRLSIGRLLCFSRRARPPN